MKKLTVREFKLSDLDDLEDYVDLDYILRYSLIPLAARAKSISFCEKKKVIAVMGAWEMLPHISGVGLIVTPRIQKYPVFFVKEIKKALTIFNAYYDVYKTYMMVDEREPELQRWAEFLKFTEEYRMKRIVNKKHDYIGYSIDWSRIGGN